MVNSQTRQSGVVELRLDSIVDGKYYVAISCLLKPFHARLTFCPFYSFLELLDPKQITMGKNHKKLTVAGIKPRTSLSRGSKKAQNILVNKNFPLNFNFDIKLIRIEAYL